MFNEINARKLGEFEYNVFKDFFNNWLFLVIMILTIGIQIALVQYGGQPIRCVPLTYEQHGLCMAMGFISLPWAVVVKLLLPAKWFTVFQMKEVTMTDEEEKSAFTTHFRKSFRSSHRLSGL